MSGKALASGLTRWLMAWSGPGPAASAVPLIFIRPGQGSVQPPCFLESKARNRRAVADSVKPLTIRLWWAVWAVASTFPLLLAEAQTVKQAAPPRTLPPADSQPSPPPPPPETVALPEASTDNDQTSSLFDGTSEFLTLADVIASLYRAYPEIIRARQETPLASGELLAAYGEFDTKLEGYSLSEPTGFYENYRHGIAAARRTWWGGYLSAGYRIGRGDFQPWYKERETEKGGEVKLAMSVPLLQGRAIDAQRVAVFQQSLARQAAEPKIQQAILASARDAAAVYWDWVAAGAILEAQQELVQLAERRGEQYQAGVQAGKFAEIDLILNQQLIAERRGKALEAEQKYRATAFKLSLFLRGPANQPLVPDDEWLPDRFPKIESPPPGDFQADLRDALVRRPEPRILQLERQQVEWDLRLARNHRLPRFDLVTEASQDMGDPASSADDKGQFQLVVGVQGNVPIQRRKARGKMLASTAKIGQIEQKLRLQRDKIAVELQTAYNALQLSAEAVEQAEASLRAAFDTLQRYRFAFDRGKIDLIYLNLLETKANETEIKLVDAQRRWFASLVDMQIALGLDPLDQAVLVSSSPASERPGPGHLPARDEPAADSLERDWQLHTTPPAGTGPTE